MPAVVGRMVLLVALAMPTLTLAEPLRVALAGTHRALSSDAASNLDAAFATTLAEALERRLEWVGAAGAADVRVGVGAGGARYFQSALAALGAAADGPSDWSRMRGETFCIAAGNPHAATVALRTGAVPRAYPSSAEALVGLKLGKCRVVVEDAQLLESLATLPEWRRFNRLLPPMRGTELSYGVETAEPVLQAKIDQRLLHWKSEGRLDRLARQAIDDVAFQAYVLADTLDCH